MEILLVVVDLMIGVNLKKKILVMAMGVVELLIAGWVVVMVVVVMMVVVVVVMVVVIVGVGVVHLELVHQKL
jgi:ABC-type multidrug transport system permease subunit